MRVNWAVAAGYSLDPAVNIDIIKGIGPLWGSWQTWRGCLAARRCAPVQGQALRHDALPQQRARHLEPVVRIGDLDAPAARAGPGELMAAPPARR